LACGAIDIGGSLAPFSSVGPSADGRIKPDVVALGVGASVVLSGGGLGTNNGTSFSAPLVAGLAAGVTQAFPYLTSAQVYQAIIKSANRASSPDNSYGYGVPFFTAVKNYVDESDTISVYPNPSNSDKVNIKFTYNTGDAMVYFFDTFGRLMLQRSVTIASASNPIEFDVSALASGVYIIKVRSSFATKTFRFVRSG
jgi:serine protease AprX